MGIGTSDFGASQIDAGTQGAPPPLEMSSFLPDLCLGAISSPVARDPVSVLSPNFQRFLDRESAARSPLPLPRVTVDAAVSAVVNYVDVAIDACVGAVDQSIQAVVETGEASTDYDPPVETLPAAPSPLAAGSPEVVEADTEQSDVHRTAAPKVSLRWPTISPFAVLCLLSLFRRVLSPIWLLRLLRRLQWDPVYWIPTTNPLRLVCQVT